MEHLAEVGAKTMFATHYHQLNALADQIPTIANFRVSVEEFGHDLVWTHKVLPGGTDRTTVSMSPESPACVSVLNRAAEVLEDLEETPTLRRRSHLRSNDSNSACSSSNRRRSNKSCRTWTSTA